MPEPYCTCCDLPLYSCSRATTEERAAAANAAQHAASPTPPPPAPETIPSRTLTTRSRRAWSPINRGRDFPALCTNEHCRRPKPNGEPNPRQTGGTANLCAECEERIRNNLTAVAEAWPDLEAALAGSLHLDGDRVHGTPSPGIVLDEDVQRAKIAIEESLTFYGRLISEERGAAYPNQNPTIPDLARWIGTTHLPWLACHSDPGVSASLAADAFHARRLTYRHAYETRPKRISLPFRCNEQVPVDPARKDSPTRICLGLMHTTLHPGRDTMPDLVCEQGHSIPPSTWMRGTWRSAPIDQGAMTALVRAITSHATHTSETGREAS